MGQYGKGFIIGLLAIIVIFAIVFLYIHGKQDFAVFLAQSIVDNAIFCVMFIMVVLVTGISC